MSAVVFFADPASELATLQNIFAVAGVPTDATTVTLTITDPSGAVTTPAVTHSGTGTYTANIPCTLDGIWIYKWVGTGTASDVQEGTWTVGPSDLTRLYCTSEELRSRLQIAGSGSDFELGIAAAAACRGVDGYCDRYFWRGTDTRTYVPDDACRVSIDDLVSATTVKVDRDGDGVYEETWVAGTDYQLLPVNPARMGETRPYTKIRAVGSLTFPCTSRRVPGRPDRVQVAGVFGWPVAVPAMVKAGSLITGGELFKLMKNLPPGADIPGEFAPPPVIAMIASNPVTAQMLGPYRRSPVLAA